MDDYAGRVLADRYRLPLPPSDAFELVETRAFDTYSGQEVLVRQIPLPEVVDAELVEAGPGAPVPGRESAPGRGRPPGRTVAGASDPAVRRALDAATAAARIPDHPRLDQVFHVFAEAGSLWIVSELVPARPLAAVLAERTLSPHRAAEVAADVLTALRALHAQGWTHRNITTRTVLICEDGRAVLTGLAAGAAEEALCGYDPVPAAGAGAEGTEGVQGTGGTQGTGGAEGKAGRAESREAYVPRPGGNGAAGGGRPAGRAAGGGRPGGVPAGGGFAGGGHPGGGQPSGGPTSGGFAGGGFAGGGPTGGGPTGGGAPAPHGPRRGPRADAVAAYRAGTLAAARAGRPPTSASTWGGGSAASGTAPAPGTTPPWSADALVGGGPAGGAAPGRPEPEAASTGGATAPAAWGRPADAAGALAAERARQARMLVVGPVTERWAPEQAWPVREDWQLAPPVGPAADLWALGALLFRAVQGHAPYPEESAAELVRLVCSEPPAYAEECGALRPVVESLMRKDPAERPDFEELRGWLRSLIRSAPEPDVGSRTVTVPPPAPDDPSAVPAAKGTARLPIVRRRGELVRRRRGRGTAGGPPAAAPPAHGRHKRADRGRPRVPGGVAATGHLQEQHVYGVQPAHRLGRLLLGAVLLLLVGAVLYALLFMPRASESAGAGQGTPRTADALGAAPGTFGRSGPPREDEATAEAGGVAKGFTLRRDPKGFTVAVAREWQRRGDNERGQVVYAGGDFELIVVPGRDKVSEFGADPMAYQQEKEPELAAFRSSSWSGSSGLRRVDVGRRAGAEGTFNWNDESGRQVYVRNSAVILDGRYHVLQVLGPMDGQRSVDSFFDQATATYRAGSSA
ncbi:protein kinase [Streptomyces sp. URMC 126]|uniref:protein kinase n=1 Tax=Streptomyces sp. URMC 126 TaxID=3423401 RepID=UPI003F1DC624